jgi:hypothetical protein
VDRRLDSGGILSLPLALWFRSSPHLRLFDSWYLI